ATGTAAFVLCVWVFQHIPSIGIVEDYLAEIKRVLRPDGSFVLQVQGSRFPWPYGPLRNRLVESGFWSQLLSHLTADQTIAKAFPGTLLGARDLRRICERHGLTVIEAAADDAPGAYWVYGVSSRS